MANQMAAVACQVVATDQEVSACCADIEKALGSVYKNCKAYPFGSRVTGLGNKVCCGYYHYIVK